jgi:acrylyl-CoA reductase (NADPH)
MVCVNGCYLNIGNVYDLGWRVTVSDFKALVVDKEADNQHAAIRTVSFGELPEGDVLVQVAYSSLNYKDGLAVTGKGKVLRSFPMVPGIDLAGVVAESSSPAFKKGDPVILTGWGVGERHWGGFAQYARVKSDWLVPLPAGLNLQQAMAIGTAGFTAMLCVMALEAHQVNPDSGSVVVTGASGGVGSIAVAILAKLGYQPVASTGRTELTDYLKRLGAGSIVDRSVFSEPSKRPLESAQWIGAVDTVGGDTLASLLKQLIPGGSVAACGNAGGFQLNTTVFPFILRGANLLGIDSVMCPSGPRFEAWRRLSQDLPLDLLEEMTQVAPVTDIPALSEQILAGQTRGRTVIDVNG